MSDFHDPADDFDGIREEDNPMPSWWLATFYGAIIFSAIYVLHYHVGTDDSIAKQYAKQMEAIGQKRSTGPTVDLASFVATAEDIGLGQAIFMERCAVCHGSKGEGGIGLKLNDLEWKHGAGTLKDIYPSIAEGYPAAGMPSWKELLSSEQMVQVSAFVESLSKSN